MSKEKVKKPYTMKTFSNDLFWVSVVILSLVMIIFDCLDAEISAFIRRYIPMAVSGFLLTYCIIRSKAKNFKKSDKDSFKKVSYAIPVAVAIAMLLYAFYSVNKIIDNTIEEISDMTFVSEDMVTEMCKDEIAETRRSLNLWWFATFATYLIFAELGAFLSLKKVDKLMQKDEIIQTESMQTQNVIEGQVAVTNEEKQDVPSNNTINWNL